MPPIKPPQGAYLSRVGTERCGKDFGGAVKLNECSTKAEARNQVRFKEMSEKRANHRRGIVKNHVITQNRRDGDPKRQVECIRAGMIQIRRVIGVKMA